jgi:hypothetical protein
LRIPDGNDYTQTKTGSFSVTQILISIFSPKKGTIFIARIIGHKWLKFPEFYQLVPAEATCR